MTSQAVLLYMPVIHRGYLEYLEGTRGRPDCYLIGRLALEQLGPEADYIVRKDHAIRALPDEIVRSFVESLDLFNAVHVFTGRELLEPLHIRCPDEDVCHLAASRFFPRTKVTFDPSIRLRYDRKGIERVDAVPDAVAVTSEEAHRQLMGKAEELAGKSKDWWLSVGGLVARDGKPLFTAWNKAALDPDIQNILGDPRSAFSRGQGTDDTLVNHAERSLVSQAARAGVSLLDADAYVTHFPCVPCGASLAESGISRLFFKSGYSRLESAEIFRTRGIDLFRVVDA